MKALKSLFTQGTICWAEPSIDYERLRRLASPKYQELRENILKNIKQQLAKGDNCDSGLMGSQQSEQCTKNQ